MKANRLIKANIDALLRLHGKTRKDLAQWCFKSESWISKVMKEERREFATTDLDRIADFFGKEPYQLFLPGASQETERRSAVDRRGGRERRVGHQYRLMLGLQTALAPYQKPSSETQVSPEARHGGGLPPEVVAEVQRLNQEYSSKLRALLSQAESRGQAAKTLRRLPKPPAGR
jgi:hypothetical protein